MLIFILSLHDRDYMWIYECSTVDICKLHKQTRHCLIDLFLQEIKSATSEGRCSGWWHFLVPPARAGLSDKFFKSFEISFLSHRNLFRKNKPSFIVVIVSMCQRLHDHLIYFRKRFKPEVYTPLRFAQLFVLFLFHNWGRLCPTWLVFLIINCFFLAAIAAL